MKRRNFLKTAGYSAAATFIAPQLSESQTAGNTASLKTKSADNQVSVKVTDGRIYVETQTLTAVIEKGVLTSLKSRINNEEFIEKPDIQTYRALQVLYRNNEVINVNEEKFGSIEARQISPQRAEVVFNSWDGDGVLSISADPETGDLLIEPSAYSSRPGVLACRWNISGIKPSLELVAPLFQGIKLKLDDPLIKNNRWIWPSSWEAGLAILQSKEGGFWVHTQDNQYRFKALQTGMESNPFVIGFDSETNGPIDNNLGAGGHLFKSWQTSAEGLERAGGCNLNEVLFGRLCRSFGYSSLSGRNEDEELRMKIHLEHGAIPTITIRSAEEIINPNAAVKRMLDLANI